MKLEEIFDDSLGLEWKREGNSIITGFKIEDMIYQIQITKMLSNITKFEELDRKKIGEVSFSLYSEPNKEKSFSTTNKFKKIPSRVYGIVKNELISKYHQYDAFYFTIERRHSNSNREFLIKKKIYEALSSGVSSGNKGRYIKKTKSGFEYLLTNINLSNSHGWYNNILALSERMHITIVS